MEDSNTSANPSIHDVSDPADPAKYSSWPGAPGSRPRSATVVIRKADGGIIGT